MIQALGDRPVIAHDAKQLGDVPPNLVFDTAVAGLPARPGPPRLPARRARRGARDRRRRRRRARHLRRPDPRAGQAPAPADPRARPHRPDDTRSSSRSCTSCARPRRTGIKLDTRQLETVATRINADVIELEREIWELAGRGVRDRLAPAARRDPVREAQALPQAPRQDRLQHRRARAAGDPRRAPDHPQDRALPRAVQARPDLPRRAPELDRRRRPPAHDLRADDRRDRAPLQHQPEPPEHPDPYRDGSRDPRLLHRRARQRAALGRLRPGRAARARPHRQRAGAARHLPARRGRAHRDRVRRLRAPARAARRRHALQGQDGQLRDRLRPLRLRPGRPPADPAGRGAGVHRPLPRALPGRRAVHEGRGRAGRAARLREHAVRPPPPDPRDPRPQLADAQPRRAGSRSTP